jgi:hypothetical protein
MNGIINHTVTTDDTDHPDVLPSRSHVAASHTSDDGHRPMEPVHTPTGASCTLSSVRLTSMADGCTLDADHGHFAPTAHD